jgi:hypothetical protein
MTGRHRHLSARRITVGAVAMIAVAGVTVATTAGTAVAAGTTTYSATQTLPVPPASNFAGSGGGDGWGLAFTSTAVFNVFHHQTAMTVACHKQSDASPCYNPVTVTDAGGHNFATSGQPAIYIDPSTAKLYIYGTRDDNTAGVVCFSTAAAAATSNPFCGFTALTPVGDGAISNNSALGDPLLVGSKLYSFNYFPGSAVTGARNKMLCFDVSTLAACTNQPFAVSVGNGSNDDNDFPEPADALIGGELLLPGTFNGTPEITCFNPATNATCAGGWPLTALGNYSVGNAGAPFPLLSGAGAVNGFCLPDISVECFTLAGASTTTPPNMASTISFGTGWNGPAAVIGPRVYVPIGGTDQVACYDANTQSSCANFPKSFNNLSFLYTVTVDPQRPTCLWVNSDNGSAQIQNFDAYSAGACGAGQIRVLAASFVVPTVLCQPASYTSLQIVDPPRGSYASGTIAFQDASGNPIPGVPNQTVDANGSVDLSHLNLTTTSGLPQFVITLTGQTGAPGSVTVKLTWTGTDDPTCIPGGGPPPSQVLMTGRAFAAEGTVYLLGQSAVVLSPSIEDTGLVSTTQTKTVAPQCAASPPLLYLLCSRVVTNASTGTVTASDTTLALSLGIPNWPSLPAIVLRALTVSSTTSCAGSTGMMELAYLKIGTTTLINGPTLIKPNTTLRLGLATIVLNEQIHTAGGLIVNGIDLNVGRKALAGANVIVASATTGISGC